MRNLNTCPNCKIEWTICDEDCCGGIAYCYLCGIEKTEVQNDKKGENMKKAIKNKTCSEQTNQGGR